MKVMILGDSPFLQTGFGKVNRVAMDRLLSEGVDVAAVLGLVDNKPKERLPIKTYVNPQKEDTLSLRVIPEAIEDFGPDIIYSTADPGTAAAMAHVIPDMPAFFYSPIEGEPIPNQFWKSFIYNIPMATVSEYGANVVKKEMGVDINWYYHGIEHDIFQQTGVRDDVRKTLGWEDKFVITMVSTNVRRKQIPRLIEAFAKLKYQYKQKDIVLYLHTVPFQNHWLEGWNLMEIARMFNVEKDVFFHPLMKERNASVPVRSDDAGHPGLVEMYNASDLFVLPSQVEGFGLPIAEAMACGVPVMVTKYAAGWEVAQPAGKGIPVKDWEIHKSGTIYANVDTDLLAKSILKLKRNPKELERMRQRGLQRATDFVWAPFEDALTKNLEDSINAYTVSHSEKQIEDKAEEEATD
jgi:glycosyltransferase involved in cell wall biosynthesis